MKQETEIIPGVFVSVMRKERWNERVNSLHGDDLKEFVEKCNPASSGINIMTQHFLGMSVKRFYEICLELDPEFNPRTDYYIFRYVPKKKEHQVI